MTDQSIEFGRLINPLPPKPNIFETIPQLPGEVQTGTGIIIGLAALVIVSVCGYRVFTGRPAHWLKRPVERADASRVT